MSITNSIFFPISSHFPQPANIFLDNGSAPESHGPNNRFIKILSLKYCLQKYCLSGVNSSQNGEICCK